MDGTFIEHQRIAHENGERLLKDPSIALKAITQQQSTFTDQDLVHFVNRNSASSEQFTQMYEAIKASPELVHLGRDNEGRDRFSTKKLLTLESTMVDQSNKKRPSNRMG